MNSRWAVLVAASLVAFFSFVLTWQLRHCDGGQEGRISSVAQSFLSGEELARITNIVDRTQRNVPLSGWGWLYDLVLPPDARVFITDMTGPTNWSKIMYHHFMTYYLFPREIGVSVDQPTRIAHNEFLGRSSESDHEILTNGFDVRLDFSAENRPPAKALKDLSLKFPTNPDWFGSNTDLVIAFLLPLLTTLAGMWLFRFLFPTLVGQMPLLEQLTCSMGLGMMAVAALTLGVKLCGWHGYRLIFLATAMGALAEIERNRKAYWAGIADASRKMVHRPVIIILFVAGLLVFAGLFRLAGLQEVMEYDAVMAWLLKAKIIHLYTGNDIVQWFSNPRLAQAHLDYPTLVPSLHAATYDSLGHVDEFVTKFWPTWMLFFLLAGLASLTRSGKNLFHAPYFALLGLLILPATQKYVQYEGGTLPMIFFTVMGFVQCALWLVGKDRARLGLGLTLLFGAAMAKFEGFIFLALVGGWLLLVPSARPSLRLSTHFWRLPAFWFLAALPFVCLRVQIPVLHFESGWAGYALHNPGATLLNCPWILMILFARFFVNSDFADWSGDNGQLHWIGRWDSLASVYNHSTVGLAWFCTLLTVGLWFAIPARRTIIVWMLAMLVGALVAFSVVFASLFNISDVTTIIGYTKDHIAGRYLLPLLLAWFTTLITMFFTDQPSATSGLTTNTAVTESPAFSGNTSGSLPVLKGGCWLAVGALLIVALGVFVLPKNESPPPENSMQSVATIHPLDKSERNSPENLELKRRNELAIQLQRTGKFAEALQEFREIARLYPNDPMALNNLAWSLAANPKQELRNGPEAVQLASKAVELTGQQQAVPIATLAAAYAEDGQFAKAVEMAKKARAIALLTYQLRLAAITEQFMQQYSAGKAVGSMNGS